VARPRGFFNTQKKEERKKRDKGERGERGPWTAMITNSR